MPLLGQFVKCSVYMVTVRYRLSIYLLMAANVVEGLSGGFPTMIMSCYAYLTQICRNDKLTTRLTAIDATCGLCGAICQVIMGLAISHIGYMWPFIMVIGLHLVNFIYVLLFVPELKKEVKHDRHYVPVTKQLMRGLELYVSSDDYGAVWQRWLLLVAMLCCNTVVIARWGPLTLYCMKYPLCWSSVLIGIYVAFTSICSNAGEIGLVATLHRRLHDVGLAIIGCISGILYFVLLAFCKTTWSMFLVTPVGSGSFLPTAMLRVMNSKLTPGDRQGAMYSILSLLDITCELTGSVVFNLIYGATQLIMATLVFFVMSGLEFLGMAIIIIYFLKSGKGRQQEVFTRETTRTEYEPIT
ncbi:hypothetical protein LSH36_181g02004 [Paralvinella palmiformis]|uniref:Uncharacterized protein n=1 Tax=Paralvinella palmiformis TaxID=53620 RepID=A0AAD9JRA9_9ANNE|nr:hypothetical protein LSH36_181g02004 [Paralvinella palmiformis]